MPETANARVVRNDPGTRVTIASSAPVCICAVFYVPAPF